jgi:hypothetical protein
MSRRIRYCQYQHPIPPGEEKCPTCQKFAIRVGILLGGYIIIMLAAKGFGL